MGEIRTSTDYFFEYNITQFRYFSFRAMMFDLEDGWNYFFEVKSFKLIEGSDSVTSMLMGKKYNVNVSLSGGENITIKCKDLATAELIMNVFRENSSIIENISTSKSTSKSTLKEKLEEILELKNQGILSDEEYESKRKQIIEKY